MSNKSANYMEKSINIIKETPFNKELYIKTKQEKNRMKQIKANNNKRFEGKILKAFDVRG